MLRQETLRRRLEVLHDPMTLCSQLGMRPTPVQREMLELYSHLPQQMHSVGDEKHEVLRAAAMCALWRLLKTEGASAIVLSSSTELSVEFMGFLERVCQKINPQLAEVTAFPQWNVLKIGQSAGWELRLMSNKPLWVAEKAPNCLVGVILGGSGRDMDFQGACEALERHVRHPRHTRIVVW